MIKVQTHTAEYAGSSEEIGRRFGRFIVGTPALEFHTTPLPGFGAQQAAQAFALFDRWCPGITEEIHGFAEQVGAEPEQVLFLSMTCLMPRCGGIALLPDMTAEGKPLLVRNYEFGHNEEEFCFIKTSVTGKYSHMGTGVVHFGRDDGINEHGLAITMSSCGFPVGPLPYMRAPAIKGLNFWAVIRTLLENCKDVYEALKFLEGMPIAYNINLILLDRFGTAALFETLDGRSAHKIIGPYSPERMLWATNHAVLPELVLFEPEIMLHSDVRYKTIHNKLSGRTGVTRDELKDLMLTKYPEGLCCHFYEEYFGTTKSMILSPVDRTAEICFGGRAQNGWDTYDIRKPVKNSARTIELASEKASPETYTLIKRA